MGEGADRTTIERWPKAELHVHLEGSVSPGLLLELARRNGVDLTAPVIFPFSRQLVEPPAGIERGEYRLSNFQDFICIYLKIVQSIRRDEDIVTVADAMIRGAAPQGIVAIEAYFSPTTFQLFDIPLEGLYDGLIEGQRIAHQAGISLRWIFDIVRNSSADGFDVIRLALAARKRGVDLCAIGLAGYEALVPARNFARAFEKARAESFKTLAHAGETAGAESVAETVELLRPDRIGHGIRAVDDARVLAQLAKSGVPVEVSPWSNISLKLAPIESHPLLQMLEAGVNVVLAADDPGIFQRDLVDNFMYAAENGVPLSHLEQLAARSVALAR